MKILMLGKTGQVGAALTPLLRQLAGSSADEAVVTLGRADVDLSDAAALAQAVQRVQPSLIVNAAAHTAVDRAETEPDIAFAINAVAPGVLAEQAAKLNALLVHYSTDYVFDGSQRTPYRESDPTHPLGVYGESKLAGEQAVQDSGCRHLLLRTSWVYDSTGRNFLTTMLRLAKQHGKLRVVGDQHGSPTSAAMIAEASLQLIRSMLNQPAMQGGLYHLESARDARRPVSPDRAGTNHLAWLCPGHHAQSWAGCSDRGHHNGRLSNTRQTTSLFGPG